MKVRFLKVYKQYLDKKKGKKEDKKDMKEENIDEAIPLIRSAD